MAKGIAAALMIYAPPESLLGVKAGDDKERLLKFYRLNSKTEWRYKSLYTKEPETIDWLNQIQPGEVLWDIGANVGLYTVYAAAMREARVWAFEPLASNYHVLNMNIELNGLDDRARAFCLAFADHAGCDVLNVQSSMAGAAQCSFEEAINDSGEHYTPSFLQGMIGYAVDDFIERFNPEFPNHMKIDVDGIEEKIIVGAAKTLRDPRLKTLSVELNKNRGDSVAFVKQSVEAAGFILARNDRTSPLYPNSSVINFQFARPQG